jgi:hypothetical protein
VDFFGEYRWNLRERRDLNPEQRRQLHHTASAVQILSSEYF